MFQDSIFIFSPLLLYILNSPGDPLQKDALDLDEMELFPHNSPHSAELCTGNWKGVNNTPVLCLLLSSTGTASVPTL